MLQVINESLNDIVSFNNRTMTDIERLEYFLSSSGLQFSRKDYMNIFKTISSATASRDLKKGLEMGYFEKT